MRKVTTLVDSATEARVREIFAAQREARWVTKRSTAAERIAKLRRLRDVIVAHQHEVTESLRADLRRADPTEVPNEVYDVLFDIDDAIANLADWMEPEQHASHESLAGTAQRVTYEGRGAVLLFGPWNFPFNLIFQPLVPIIAAGNTAIVKPNELSPNTSALVTRIIREAFDETDVAVFEGGIDLANLLLEFPFDHIFFTGSPKVAKVVMAAAANHLASVTLELGGKCPVIVDGTTNLDDVVASVAGGKVYNAGQICLTPDHAWIHEDVVDEFVAKFSTWITDNLYPGGDFAEQHFGRIVDERNFDRVQSYISDAIDRGARLIGTGASDRSTLTIHPGLLLDVPLNADIMQEEIFGPVLPVHTYRDPAEIIEHVRSGGKPLAIYVYSSDADFVDEVVASTSSGGVTVNGWATHYAAKNLPFGGVGSSGLGAYHGVHGFRALSHARAVVEHPVAV